MEGKALVSQDDGAGRILERGNRERGNDRELR